MRVGASESARMMISVGAVPFCQRPVLRSLGIRAVIFRSAGRATAGRETRRSHRGEPQWGQTVHGLSGCLESPSLSSGVGSNNFAS